MKRLLAALLLAITAQGFAQESVFGHWAGVIGPGQLDLGINVSIQGSEEAPEATIDIPVQGLFDYPLTEVVARDGSFSALMPGIPGDPRLEASLGEDGLNGTFSQSGATFELVLERSEGPAGLNRPQEPELPLPYYTEEVTVVSPAGDVTLAGTLTLPEGDGPFTAVLFITGSGPQDRDEALFGHRPFFVLSDLLTRAGYATLRLDDRGVGGSGGDDAQATYEDMAADGIAAVEFLAARDEIAGVGLLGHSQGGYLAPVIAQTADVDFIISLAGPAVSGEEVLLLQNRLIIESSVPAGVPAEQVEAAVQMQLGFLEGFFGLLRAGDIEGARGAVTEMVKMQLGSNHGLTEEEFAELVEAQADANTSPSMVSFMTFDPQPSLRQTTVPFLAVYGGLDVQVDAVQSSGPLEEALTAAGNGDFSIVVIDDMNHSLQPAVTGSLDEYPLIETTVHEELIALLPEWLDARFAD